MDLRKLARTLKGAVVTSILAAVCLTAMASPLLHYLTTKPLREMLWDPSPAMQPSSDRLSPRQSDARCSFSRG